MGTTEETYPGSQDYYYAFGGKPYADWRGVDGLGDRIMNNFRVRPLDPVSGQKAAAHRIKGLTTKFTHKSKLSDFQKAVWKHLTTHGLDTIAYLIDPSNASEVLSVVTHHARYNNDLEKAESLSNIFKTKFDNFDKAHDFEATQFLVASLGPDVREGFEPFQKENDTFALTWLRLIHYLVTATSQTYDEMKAEIRNARPQNFEGQNIELMSKAFIAKGKELFNAGYYDHGLTLNMVDSFLCADKDSKNTFHHEMNNLRSSVEDKIHLTKFLPRSDQDDAFAKDKLTYTDVCSRAVKSYKTLVHNNMWEPAKLPKDRQAPLINFSQAQINMLIESMKKNVTPSSSHKTFKCFLCGEPGHRARDCPNASKRGAKTDSTSSKNSRHKSMAKWKLIAPKGSEPEKKTVDGRVFYWCGKCGNWTPTHGTATHTGKSNKNSSRKEARGDQESANLAALDPSAWIVIHDDGVPSNEVHTFSILHWLYFGLTLLLFVLPAIIVDVVDLIPSARATVPILASTLSTRLSSFDPATVLHRFSHLLGPISWILCGYTIAHLSHLSSSSLFDPTLLDNEEPTRSIRRHHERWKHRTRRRMKLRSARDHGLHPSYPLRLRHDNSFRTRSSAPSTLDQHLQHLRNDMHRRADHAAATHLRSHRRASHSTDNVNHRHWSRSRRRDHPRSCRHVRPSHHDHPPVIAHPVDTRQPYRPVAIPTVLNPRPNLRPTRTQQSRWNRIRAQAHVVS